MNTSCCLVHLSGDFAASCRKLAVCSSGRLQYWALAGVGDRDDLLAFSGTMISFFFVRSMVITSRSAGGTGVGLR
jgi:hypothetical protein